MADTHNFTQVLLSENENESSGGSVDINPDLQHTSIQFNTTTHNNNNKPPTRRVKNKSNDSGQHLNNKKISSSSLQFDSTTSNSIPNTPTKMFSSFLPSRPTRTIILQFITKKLKHDWNFLLLLGVTMALISYGLDILIESVLHLQLVVNEKVETVSDHSVLNFILGYLVWILQCVQNFLAGFEIWSFLRFLE